MTEVISNNKEAFIEACQDKEDKDLVKIVIESNNHDIQFYGQEFRESLCAKKPTQVELMHQPGMWRYVKMMNRSESDKMNNF